MEKEGFNPLFLITLKKMYFKNIFKNIVCWLRVN